MSKPTESAPDIIFFRTAAEFREWLEENHETAEMLNVGYYRKTSGRPTMTWSESVDEALCFGWIDGIRKKIDEISYTIRFTKRRPRSVWSTININKALTLIDQGRMRPAGLKSFELKLENKSGIYSYEQRKAELDEPYAGIFRRNKKAWNFFEAQPPGYRKMAIWWIVSAKTEATRHKRLARVIEDSSNGQRI